MTTVIVERELDYFSDTGVERGFARVFEPQPDQDDWRCAYQLVWPGYDRTRYAMGVDRWQALQLAMRITPTMISTSEDCKAGRLGIWGAKFESEQQVYELFGEKLVEGPHA